VLQAAKEVLGIANAAADADPSNVDLAAAVTAAQAVVEARKIDLQSAKDAEAAATAASTADGSNSNTTTVVIVVAVVLILLIVGFAVAAKNRMEQKSGRNGAYEEGSVAFENPMYGNVVGGIGGGGGSGGSGQQQQPQGNIAGLYQDATPRNGGGDGSGYMDVSGSAATAGYVDVAAASPGTFGDFDSDDEDV
jgi:hypothetical protein